jgi:hypothetical protein
VPWTSPGAGSSVVWSRSASAWPSGERPSSSVPVVVVVCQFFIGLTWQHTRGSALIGFVGDDAAFIAGRLGSQLKNRAGLAPVDSERT